MAVMAEEARQTLGMPRTSQWRVEDLERLPDDGLRYELVDGALLVTPAPSPAHQTAAIGILCALRDACPPDMQVFIAPLDFQPDGFNSLQPDVLVVLRSEVPESGALGKPPLLVVEVLSPTTRRRDLTIKRDVYRSFGVRSYWVFDPDGPTLTVLELRKGDYRQVAKASGGRYVSVLHPYPMRLRPGELANG